MTCWRTKRAAAAISLTRSGADLSGGAVIVSLGTALSMLTLCCKTRGGACQKIAVQKDFCVRGERFGVRRNFSGEVARHDDDHAGIGFAQGFGIGKCTTMALPDQR